jgi:hypothetical protein
MVLPMDSILQTGMLVLFTNPTATELFGMAVRGADAVRDAAHHVLDTFLVNGSCTLAFVRETTSQSA